MTPPSKRSRYAKHADTSISTQTFISPAITAKPGFLSLAAYINNFFYDVFVQDHDEVAEIVFNRDLSHHLKEL